MGARGCAVISDLASTCVAGFMRRSMRAMREQDAFGRVSGRPVHEARPRLDAAVVPSRRGQRTTELR